MHATLFSWIKNRLESFYHWADAHSGGVVRILVLSVQRFGRVRGAEAAASIAYYALFSLFPLMLILTAVLGFVLVNAEAPGSVVDFVTTVIPTQRALIEDNLLQILKARGASLTSGILVLLWSASGVFLTLVRNINRAWPGALARNLVQGRIMAFTMIAVLSGLMILSVALGTLFSLLATLQIPIRGSITIYDTFLWRMVTVFAPWALVFVVFVGLYQWVPNTHVRWREASWGALFSTLAWYATSKGFGWYLRSGLVSFEVVYGSLATILILLTWIYLGSLITLFGAHISSSVAFVKRLEEKEN